MTPDDLSRVCTAIIGRDWQRPLARILGAFHPLGARDSLDDRLVRRWASGAKPIPAWVEPALIFIAEQRVEAMRANLVEAEKVAGELRRNDQTHDPALVAFAESVAQTPWQGRIYGDP